MTIVKAKNSDELLDQLKKFSERGDSKWGFLHKRLINTLRLWYEHGTDEQDGTNWIKIPRSESHDAAVIRYSDDEGSGYLRLLEIETLEFKLLGLKEIREIDKFVVELAQ